MTARQLAEALEYFMGQRRAISNVTFVTWETEDEQKLVVHDESGHTFTVTVTDVS